MVGGFLSTVFVFRANVFCIVTHVQFNAWWKISVFTCTVAITRFVALLDSRETGVKEFTFANGNPLLSTKVHVFKKEGSHFVMSGLTCVPGLHFLF